MRKTVLKLVLLTLLMFVIALPSHAAGQDRLKRDTVYQVMDLIVQHYNDNTGNSAQIEKRIKSLVESLNDPYSYFLNPSEYKELMNEYANNYVGIGILFNMSDNYPCIVRVYDDTPASDAGLQPGDVIIKVNGGNTADMSMEEFYTVMGGPDGSKIRITVRRSGVKDFELSLVRESIHISAVYYDVFDDGIGYIGLSQFSFDSAKEFRLAAAALKQQGVKELIVDLRGNPGGFLTEAASIAGLFLMPGKPLSRITNVDGYSEVVRATGMPICREMNTIVLVDEYSASASELVSGALQDYQVAIIVGGKTFGKGTVQDLFPLKNGAAVNITVAEYFTPLKRPVNGVGITPDYKVNDPLLQLEKARELLKLQRDNKASATR